MGNNAEKELLLVHDKGNLSMDEDAATFETIKRMTPPELVGERGAGGIYCTVRKRPPQVGCGPGHSLLGQAGAHRQGTKGGQKGSVEL